MVLRDDIITAQLGRTETSFPAFEGKEWSEWNKALVWNKTVNNVIPGTFPSSCSQYKKRDFIYIKMLLEAVATCLKNNSWKTALSLN